ncbi:cation:proton antiporter [Amycolatopsis sp. 195334CR]|uniref:cation:proton antiporter domain-containing protein n=1 Tax=Amycolatopsis sp. 195334CR TaxID=2814588 RepID=UPI001A907BD4|nr:cation:proton antiporter [Amycolatopsis sp. 195334CR]MBN6039746.1 cation:proton antiporter [Amycolatopsis sp. 195334CR]
MTALGLLHAAGALLVVLAIGWLGRFAARSLRQPEVIGEIAAGLLAGPLVIALLGRTTFDLVLPGEVVGVLKLVAEVGLVLFLVGLAHKLRGGGRAISRRTTGWLVVGGLVPALASGLLLACWIIFVEDPAVRGQAPVAAFLLMCAIVMSITAVPVLARILADRGLTDSAEGRLSMTAAIIIDTVGWLLLSVAVGLASGRLSGFLQALAVLGGGALVAFAVRAGLRTRLASALSERRPVVAGIGLAVIALVVALGVERLGLTAIFGAVLVGLAVPASGAWTGVVAAVTKVGRALIPVFFVVTGLTVFAASFGSLPWALIVVSVVLAVLGKGGGSYLGTRLAGESGHTAMKVGVLMNTRGLTELIVLKVGFSTGILTAPMFVALVIMAVVTTAMTGPLLLLLDRRAVLAQAVPS